MQKKGKNAVYLTLTGIVILLMIVLVIIHQRQPLNSSIPEATPEAVLENAAKKHNGPSFVTINTTISADVIQDGLRDMGELATEEYYFKEVVSYSSIKQFLGLNLGLTESSYLAGYEGVIKAGIDFTKITVKKDDDAKSRLQEILQSKNMPVPHYEVVREIGPDHSKIYEIEVRVGDNSLGIGQGSSKQNAAKQAAQNALENLGYA